MKCVCIHLSVLVSLIFSEISADITATSVYNLLTNRINMDVDVLRHEMNELKTKFDTTDAAVNKLIEAIQTGTHIGGSKGEGKKSVDKTLTYQKHVSTVRKSLVDEKRYLRGQMKAFEATGQEEIGLLKHQISDMRSRMNASEATVQEELGLLKQQVSDMRSQANASEAKVQEEFGLLKQQVYYMRSQMNASETTVQEEIGLLKQQVSDMHTRHDGNWSGWTEWGTCSATCNIGMMTRSRTCDHPPPSSFGRGCIGNSDDKAVCNTQACSDMHDCKDVLDAGVRRVDGLYTIYVKDNGQLTPVKVFCDMGTAGGGWTVFQYRYNGSVDFFRNFSEYEAGFGKYPGEFWLGLKWLHLISSQKQYQLRVDVTDSDVTSVTAGAGYATYTNFSVGGADKFTLHVTGFIPGNIKVDRFTYHNGSSFTTYDRDQDVSSDNCAIIYKGAWWYNYCYQSNLNGIYRTHETIDHTSMNMHWPSSNKSLKTSKLSIKPL